MNDGKWFTEKGTQPMKKEFTSTKDKFASNLIEKWCSSKIMNYLTNEDQSDSIMKCNLTSHKIKSYEFLMKNKKRITSPFCT